jgi:hypothetical protein
VVGFCERGNEPLGSTRDGECLDLESNQTFQERPYYREFKHRKDPTGRPINQRTIN